MTQESAAPLPDGIRQRTVRANGLDFPVLEAGAGSLVLCLHGFPDHARSWLALLVRLADEGYWAVAPAMRGFWPGGTAPDGSYRAAANGADIVALIAALGRDQADLVGHDFGARAVYAAASLEPARIRKSGSLCRTGRSSAPPSSRTAISSGGAGICSISKRGWPKWPYRSTTTPSSTGSGAIGRPTTACQRPSARR
jgi:pimeloyl-ACP methyl ester carboxylesterase